MDRASGRQPMFVLKLSNIHQYTVYENTQALNAEEVLHIVTTILQGCK
jgi:hypothetical protein